MEVTFPPPHGTAALGESSAGPALPPRHSAPERLAEPPSAGRPDNVENELRRLAQQARVELQFLQFPDGQQLVIQIRDPEDGALIREYPPAELARVLADLRAMAAARLDQRT